MSQTVYGIIKQRSTLTTAVSNDELKIIVEIINSDDFKPHQQQVIYDIIIAYSLENPNENIKVFNSKSTVPFCGKLISASKSNTFNESCKDVIFDDITIFPPLLIRYIHDYVVSELE